MLQCYYEVTIAVKKIEMDPEVTCAVLDCFETDLKRSFHPFPQNPVLRTLWMKACNLDQVEEDAVVCSAHFSDLDFVKKFVFVQKSVASVKIQFLAKVFKSSSQAAEAGAYMSHTLS